MSNPLVSIITVNYKQPKVTAELLTSLAQLTYSNFEVILVDNEAEKDNWEFYRQYFDRVRVFNSKENLGFAGANNLGIRHAKGEYLFFVNNDTELQGDLIQRLLACFDSPEVGAVSPVLKYHSAPDQIQFAGYTHIHPWTGRNNLIQDYSIPQTIESPYFHGAAVMIPSWVIWKIGPMPEEYFLYYEELDWSVRVREQGLKIKVCQEVSVLHKESVSTGKHSPLKLYYQTRNRVFFMQRNHGKAVPFLFFFCLVSIPKNLLFQSFQGNWKHLRAFVLGCKHALFTKTKGWVEAGQFS